MNLELKEFNRIHEIINIGIRRSSIIMNKLVNHRILLTEPSISIFSFNEYKPNYYEFTSEKLSMVSLSFKNEIYGKVEIVFPEESAVKIVNFLMKNEYPNELRDKLRASTLIEVGSIILNTLINTISTLLKKKFKYTVPYYSEINGFQLKEIFFHSKSDIILAQSKFFLNENSIEGDFQLFLDLALFDEGRDNLLVANS